MSKTDDLIKIELEKDIARLDALKKELSIIKKEIKKKERYLGVEKDGNESEEQEQG